MRRPASATSARGPPQVYILTYHTRDARTSSVVLRAGRILTLWEAAGESGIHATT